MTPSPAAASRKKSVASGAKEIDSGESVSGFAVFRFHDHGAVGLDEIRVTTFKRGHGCHFDIRSLLWNVYHLGRVGSDSTGGFTSGLRHLLHEGFDLNRYIKLAAF